MTAHGLRGGQGFTGRLLPFRVRRWALWELPGRVVLGYVLAIDVLAVVATGFAFSSSPVGVGNLLPFMVLMTCSLVYTEMSRPIERIRERYAATPHIDLNSVWMFAAVVLLHPGLAAVVISTSYFYRWTRVQHNPLHRRMFSTAAAVVAAILADWFLMSTGGHAFAEVWPHDLGTFLRLVGAGAIFLVSNTILITLAVFGTTPEVRLREAMGTPADYALESATIALGIVLAWALVDWPVALLLILGITLVLHRSVLIRQLRDQARADSKTGLLNASSWAEAAAVELSRPRRPGGTTSVLMLDLDHFKLVNDRHGHLVGDSVLRAVADTLRAELRAGDLVGRFGGEEFVVLLPDTSRFDALAIAERIRCRVAATTVSVAAGDPHKVGVTVSIGVAAHPRDAGTLDGLIKVTDKALYQAKTAGRNRTIGYDKHEPSIREDVA
ncbi:GGDEF domain-containing protein [Amycolatopsis sp. NPDC059657]|uniref:GGDEF domain-containing protein n=1 Tax=Amycolatopsis sp. NPDC059657 TaxID=3346899 RepID=UPI00366A762A